MELFTQNKNLFKISLSGEKKEPSVYESEIAIGYIRFKINSLWLKIVAFMTIFKASGLLIFPSIKITCTFRQKNKPRSASLFKDRI